MNDFKYIFIINPVSGAARNRDALLRLIHEYFSGKSYQIEYTKAPGHATQIAAGYATDSHTMLIAVGGDGTMNEVANGVVGKQAVLGLVPCGSGNGFARSLSIPVIPDRALQALLQPDVTVIDAAQINERYFFGVAGVGLDAEISVAFQNFGHRGPLPYFYLGIKSFLKYRYPQMELRFGNQVIKSQPLLITIANSTQFGNNAYIAPQAKMDDGLLDICIVEQFSFSTGLRQMRRLFNGTIEQSPFYKAYRVGAVQLINPSGNYHVDGEPCSGGQQLKINIVPKALRVAVPAIANNRSTNDTF